MRICTFVLAGAASLAALVSAAAAPRAADDGVRLLPKAPPAPDARPALDNPDHWQPGADVDMVDGDYGKAVPRETVAYAGGQPPGTIVVSTRERRLYLVLPGGQAIRYGVGVGRPGFAWAGGQTITAKREWPDWTPPAAMVKRHPEIPHHMAGGPDNPLGARALYLGRSEYRIYGSNEPDTIGQATSSGCIRMTNADVTDLYDHVAVGTRVVVQP
ncbi:L,D-transpeptidase [Lichenibacterium dinghuense]|uniref:L,D-transpeptidase n=1 Tax=Lichenibacterium dinghuense TaxID=2895977 RepID=UPI001F197665|nr:L,D-transpeptidase [Lichenibacterium sp. 6Y81]